MQKRLIDKRWPWLAAAFALVLVFLYPFVDTSNGVEDRRPVGGVEDIARLAERDDVNILFILIDTLRADRLSSYGYARDTSPNLDRWVTSGVRFAHQLSQSSWTKSSMASIFTATYPVGTAVTRFDDILPEGAHLAAETLTAAGFRTAGIYRNGWVAPTFGFGRGFELYSRPLARQIPMAVRVEKPTLGHKGTDEDVVEAALEFLRVHGDTRWFLYLHMMDLHEYIYDEESALFDGSYSGIYDNSIRWVDGTLGILMDHLSARGQLAHTIVAIVSDHGEAFRERGIEGHARSLYRETTEVPFLLFLPFRLEKGVVVQSRTQNIDIWPTLFELVGVEAPSPIDGRSLLPDILASARGDAPPDARRTALATLDQTWGQREREPFAAVAVVDGPLRYVRGRAGSEVIEHLFDATDDPGELDDLSERRSEELARLRKIADEHLATGPRWGEAPVREISELELGQLKALGYALP